MSRSLKAERARYPVFAYDADFAVSLPDDDFEFVKPLGFERALTKGSLACRASHTFEEADLVKAMSDGRMESSTITRKQAESTQLCHAHT